MPHQHSYQDILDQAVLGYLLALHPAPVHRVDLERAFAADDLATSLVDLERDGLVHRSGELVLATRAAVRGEELA